MSMSCVFVCLLDEIMRTVIIVARWLYPKPHQKTRKPCRPATEKALPLFPFHTGCIVPAPTQREREKAKRQELDAVLVL